MTNQLEIVPFLLNHWYLRSFYEQFSKKCFKAIIYKWLRVTIFQRYLFQKIKFFIKFCPVRANFETTIDQGIYHTKFVYCCQKPFKMRVNTTKSRFPISICYKISFLTRYVYIKKGQFSIFFLLKEIRHIYMKSIKIVTEFWCSVDLNKTKISSTYLL